MNEAIGKTVARVEVGVTDMEYGHWSDDTVLVHFTDGTALRIVGGSYEEVSQSADVIDRADVLRYEQAAQGRREARRLMRLKREEWESLSSEEQERRTAARRARMSPFARVLEDELGAMARSAILDASRSIFGTAGKAS